VAFGRSTIHQLERRPTWTTAGIGAKRGRADGLALEVFELLDGRVLQNDEEGPGIALEIEERD
jgi:hypothetical protein